MEFSTRRSSGASTASSHRARRAQSDDSDTYNLHLVQNKFSREEFDANFPPLPEQEEEEQPEDTDSIPEEDALLHPGFETHGLTARDIVKQKPLRHLGGAVQPGVHPADLIHRAELAIHGSFQPLHWNSQVPEEPEDPHACPPPPDDVENMKGLDVASVPWLEELTPRAPWSVDTEESLHKGALDNNVGELCIVPREPQHDIEKGYQVRTESSICRRAVATFSEDEPKLSPRDHWLHPQKSFDASDIPIAVGGVLVPPGQTKNAKARRRWVKPKRPCGLHINKCGLCLRLGMLVVSLASITILAWVVWKVVTPSVAEGGFGLLSQTDQPESIDIHFFNKAKVKAVAYGNYNPSGTTTGLSSGRWWGHVELIFYVKAGGLITEKRMPEVRNVETQVRSLPGWQRLCNKVPQAYKYYCSPGDTLATAVFSTDSAPNATAAARGVLKEVTYDGQGGTFLMPVQTLLTFLRDFQMDTLKRWVPADDTSGHMRDSPIRTLFSFFLHDDDRGEWDAFVLNDLAPALKDVAESDKNDDGLHVFYRVSRLRSEEFDRAVRGDIVYSFFVTGAALVATLLTTRRALLAVAAVLLSLAAPTMASAFAAARGFHGTLEYPAVAIGSWFLVVVSCADLAVASSCAWTARDLVLRPKGDDLELKLRFICRVCRFTVEAPLPVLASAFTLLLSGWLIDLPLYSEFASHAGLSIFIAMVLSVFVYPPAIEIGNKLHERSTKSIQLQSLSRQMHSIVPYEMGGESWCCAAGAALARDIVRVLSNPIARFVILVLSVAVILGLCLLEISPKYGWATPQLFEDDHRLSLAPKIRSRFGLAFPETSQAPPVASQTARICKVDAHEAAGCSWYQCDKSGSNRSHDECRCFYKSQGLSPLSHLPSSIVSAHYRACGSVARASGPGSDTFARTQFWPWVETVFQVPFVNGTVSSWNMGALVIEDWLSGSAISQSQLAVKTSKPDQSVPAWEDACFRAICNCGSSQCTLDASWLSIGSYALGAGGRRMSAQSNNSTAASGTVFVVWGLKRGTEILSESLETTLKFDASFDMSNPWMQRSIFATCDGPAPALSVTSKTCWAIDFKAWLEARGERFPVQSANFQARFQSFTTQLTQSQAQTSVPNTVTSNGQHNVFWVAPDGTVQGFYASFGVVAPTNDRNTIQSYMKTWNKFISDSGGRSPVAAWIASDIFADQGAEDAVKSAVISIMLSALLTVSVLVLLLTFSVGLSFATTFVLALSLGCCIIFAVGLAHQTIGVMEVIGLGTFLSSLVTPLIRVSHQYSLAQDMPKKRQSPKASPKDSPRGAGVDLVTDLQGTSTLLASRHSVTSLVPGIREQTYLVDNQHIQAATKGLGFRLSPMLQDVDKNPNMQQCMAPWGSTVVGVAHGPDWLRVNGRFLPMKLRGLPVLTLLEEEDEPMCDDSEGDSDGAHEEDNRYSSDDTRFSEIDSEGVNTFEFVQYRAQKRIHTFILWIRSLTGPFADAPLWPGVITEERAARMMTTVKLTTQPILGYSVAGMIVGLAFLPLRMEALRRIGLAVFCAAVTSPVALVLLPILLLLGFGPTRSRRLALLEFCAWYVAGRPRRHVYAAKRDSLASSKQQDVDPNMPRHGAIASQLRSVSVFYPKPDQRTSGRRSISKESASKANQGEVGEVAARVLGFPFTLEVASAVVQQFVARASTQSQPLSSGHRTFQHQATAVAQQLYARATTQRQPPPLVHRTSQNESSVVPRGERVTL